SQKLDVASGRRVPQGQIDGRKLLSQKPERERGCRTLLLRSRFFAPSLTVGFLPGQTNGRKPLSQKGAALCYSEAGPLPPPFRSGFLRGQAKGRKPLSQKPERERGCRTLLLRSRSFCTLPYGWVSTGIRRNEDSCPPAGYPGNYYDRQYSRRHCGRKQTIL